MDDELKQAHPLRLDGPVKETRAQAEPSAPDSPDSVWFFGDSERLAVELAGLVAAGTKTATACLVWEYEAAREAIPRAGRFSVVTTFAGAPLLVLETTGVVIQPFDAVDEQFAFDEGEGDRSLAYWRRAHWSYFSRRCAVLGREPSTAMPVVCEGFRVAVRAA